jgi:hypothetical protein
MASNTINVKVGVCKVFYDGYDLGYTKGGVEVEVSSESYKTEVDQFGKTAISEIISSRNVKVKVPLAETTILNMARVMPGATIVTDGVRAAGSITLGLNPTASQTIVVNGKTFTFKATATGMYDVLLGASKEATAANLYAKLVGATDGVVDLAQFTYTAGTNAITVTYGDYGASPSYTLAAGTSGATIVSLTGGVNATYMRVDVSDAVGVNLLSVAKELRLHPQENAATDKSLDFVVPLAGTAGGVQFAYRLEEERVYNCEFTGYPDPTTRRLYYIGV